MSSTKKTINMMITTMRRMFTGLEHLKEHDNERLRIWNLKVWLFCLQTESPLLIRPFMETMTRSQLHAVMTGGFATVSGSVLGAYVSYGVSGMLDFYAVRQLISLLQPRY